MSMQALREWFVPKAQLIKDWFLSKSRGSQIILSLLIVGGVVLLSPLLSAVSLVALVVSIIVVLLLLLGRKPMRSWLIVLGLCFASTVVFGGISDALYGPSSNQASSPSPSQEKTMAEAATSEQDETAQANREVTQARQEAAEAKKAQAEAEEALEEDQQQQATEAPAEPEPVAEETTQPQTPEQKLRAAIRNTFVAPEDIQNIKLVPSGTGCYDTTVNFFAEGLTAGGTIDTVEFQTEEVYTGIYSKPKLSKLACSVTVNASAQLTDNLGNVTQERMLSTTMDSATAQTINWQNSYAVDFPTVWAVNYVHPVFEEQKAVNEAKKAADCAEDEGIFDFDLDCP